MNKFGCEPNMHPSRIIEGIPVKSLINEFGRPYLSFSEAQSVQIFILLTGLLKQDIPRYNLHGHTKTNYLDAVWQSISSEGSWAEVVSGSNTERLCQTNVPGDKIIFNGPDKSEDDLKLALKNNSLIHIDHLDELLSTY